MLNKFAGAPFEDICRVWMLEWNRAGELSMYCSEIGRWWRGGDAIDILGIDKRGGHTIACECKFRNASVDMRLLHGPEEKAARLPHEEEHLVPFSKSGLTDAAVCLVLMLLHLFSSMPQDAWDEEDDKATAAA